MRGRSFLVAAALLAAAGVALGAYAAHGLNNQLESMGYADQATGRMAWFETGVRYQLYHALGILLVVSLADNQVSQRALRAVCAAFLIGILLFSGSLYVMALAPPEWKKLGAVVPLGGVSFIVGWVILAYDAWCAQKCDA
ncbi:MAG: DUF423 domain-containing protein [Planctomycetales bacterium]|nr:DUF423 domain-containing protein [Planctomycetales bacterium]